MKTETKIQELLSRGVEEIIDKTILEQKLKSKQKLRVKLGIDPTSPNIHLGRSIPLLKLRDFQELGHKIVFIVGDFTGTVGDASDKDSERPMLSERVVKENLKTYIKQVNKIIDIKKAEIYYNSKWLNKLGFAEIGKIADVFSVNDFISRENIKKRLDAGKRVSLREVLYPLMQAYDSVYIKADVEVGGTDQKFNILAGRNLQKHYDQEPQNIIIGPLIEGTDGRKMSSSWGNTINIMDEPNNMFGKVMSIRDELIIKYFTLLTRVNVSIIKDYEHRLSNGSNPRDVKLELAKEIVCFYHSKKDAIKAEDYFINTFTEKKLPKDVQQFKPSSYGIIQVLVESKLVKSKSEARRIIRQSGVKIENEIIKDENYIVNPNSTLQKGKIHFLRIN